LLTPRFTVLAPDNRRVGGSRGGAPFTLEGAADDARCDHRRRPRRAGVIGVSMAARSPATSRPAVPSWSGGWSRVVRSQPDPSHRRVLRFFELALGRLAPDEAAEALMAFAFGARFADAYPGSSTRRRACGPEPATFPVPRPGRHLAAGFDLRPIAAAVGCPALVLAGEADPIVPPPRPGAGAAIPGARYRPVPEPRTRCSRGRPGLLEEISPFSPPDLHLRITGRASVRAARSLRATRRQACSSSSG